MLFLHRYNNFLASFTLMPFKTESVVSALRRYVHVDGTLVCVCVCVCACMRMRVCVCLCVYVRRTVATTVLWLWSVAG